MKVIVFLINLSASRTGGVGAVIEEVEVEIKRLAKRNFGRDDRLA